jgi:hypothetical protein
MCYSPSCGTVANSAQRRTAVEGEGVEEVAVVEEEEEEEQEEDSRVGMRLWSWMS